MRYIELNLVKQTATPEGLQDHVAIEETDAGGVIEYRGNIGISVGLKKEKKILHDPGEFEPLVDRYLSRGYYIVPGKEKPSERKIIEKTKKGEDSGFLPEKNAAAQFLVDMLRALANKEVAETFTFSVESLTKEQIAEGRRLLTKLSDGYEEMTLKDFNLLLCHYYSVIPRRMKRVADYVARGKTKRGKSLSAKDAIQERLDIINREKERFNTLVHLLSDEKETDLGKTATESYGLEIREVTFAEEMKIRSLMKGNASQFVRAWRVINNKTEGRFVTFCEDEDLTEENGGISHLFHGSRGANFWSIITNGLQINPPEGVPICGKAYGIGTYFAPDARKSMGYTDLIGSKWANGTEKTGFMGIYKVATGNRYPGTKGCDCTLNWEKLQKLQPGAHCTWAECRYSGFMMDEVIVYKDEQSTIEYLVQFA